MRLEREVCFDSRGQRTQRQFVRVGSPVLRVGGCGSIGQFPRGRRLGRIQCLDVLEPPIVPLAFQRGKPSACNVEQHDCYSPYQVKKWKAPDVTLRWFWIAHWMVGEQPRADGPQPNL